MVDIGGRPIVWHIMKIYAAHGFRRFILCLGYKGWVIKEYFLNFKAMANDFTINLARSDSVRFHGDAIEDFEVTLADTGPESMTGARIARIRKYIRSNVFMVTYGDGLCDVNLPDLLETHRRSATIATLTAVRPSSRFGVLELDGERRVRTFKEKPRVDGLMSAGFFVFDSRIFDYLSEDADCVLEQEPLAQLAADCQLTAHVHEGFFFAMDTFREYQQLNDMWSRNAAPWRVW